MTGPSSPSRCNSDNSSDPHIEDPTPPHDTLSRPSHLSQIPRKDSASASPTEQVATTTVGNPPALSPASASNGRSPVVVAKTYEPREELAERRSESIAVGTVFDQVQRSGLNVKACVERVVYGKWYGDDACFIVFVVAFPFTGRSLRDPVLYAVVNIGLHAEDSTDIPPKIVQYSPAEIFGKPITQHKNWGRGDETQLGASPTAPVDARLTVNPYRDISWVKNYRQAIRGQSRFGDDGNIKHLFQLEAVANPIQPAAFDELRIGLLVRHWNKPFYATVDVKAKKGLMSRLDFRAWPYNRRTPALFDCRTSKDDPEKPFKKTVKEEHEGKEGLEFEKELTQDKWVELVSYPKEFENVSLFAVDAGSLTISGRLRLDPRGKARSWSDTRERYIFSPLLEDKQAWLCLIREMGGYVSYLIASTWRHVLVESPLPTPVVRETYAVVRLLLH
jgi:hypothetical protein